MRVIEVGIGVEMTLTLSRQLVRRTEMTSSALDRLRPYMTEPIVDVEGAIRSFGILLKMDAILHPEIVGQIERRGSGYVISVQGNDHPNRKRFTAAHELGHYIFHRDLLDEGIDDNRMYRSTNVGKFYNRSIKPWHETEANRFAASFLMPENLVKRYHTIHRGDLRAMAREFAVSPAAMRIRLQGLGLQPVE